MEEQEQDLENNVGPSEPGTGEAPVPVPPEAPVAPVVAATPVPTTLPITPPDPGAEAGKVVLFIDQTESVHGNATTFAQMAAFARSCGVDTIAPKRADGSIKWYGTTAELAREREAVLANGVGYLPYTYCYGPRFGDAQVRAECAVLAEIMSVNDHLVCADMESEWNGQYAAGTLFEQCMRPVPGLLWVTTFGDPKVQHFPIVQIAPAVNAWVPQDYDNYLAAMDGLDASEGMTIVEPAVDLSQEFGANNVEGIAAQMRSRGHKTLWVWCHAFAVTNPTLLRAVVAAFKG